MKSQKEFEFCGKLLGDRHPPFIVAEIGFNHNGDLDLAKKMIKSAAVNGADAVKFQTFIGEELVSRKHIVNDPDNNGQQVPLYQFFKRYELKREDYHELFAFAEKLDVPMFSTPFDESSLDMLVEMGMPAVKVASCDLTYHPFLKQVARKGLPVVLSSGMGTVDEIEQALDIIRGEGNDRVVLLHCVSNYPSHHEEMNLRCLASLRDRFRVPVGLSDHSLDNLSSVVASALGAVMIEKHFTVDRNLPGADQSISMEPDDLLDLKDTTLSVHKILGGKSKTIQPSEIPVKEQARRSLIAREDLEPGMVITPEMISFKRPGFGISPEEIDRVLGKKVKVKVSAEEVITWDMV